MPEVKICDVTLRDGMQAVNRDAVVPLAMRRDLASKLQRARLPYIEVGSFVHPRVIPAMRDTAELAASLQPADGRQLAALAPSPRYYRKLREATHVDTVAVLVSASEAYSRLNMRMTRAEALEAARQVVRSARRDGYRVRAYLSYAFRGMSAENGPMPAATVAELSARLVEAGCEEVALSDTDGKATPREIDALLTPLAAATGLEHVAVHLHDRYGSGLANALLAFQAGVRAFDSTVGGVGGNKLLAGSVGNVATEELVYLFHGMGVETGLDVEALLDAGDALLDLVRHVGDPPPPSKILAGRPGAARPDPL